MCVLLHCLFTSVRLHLHPAHTASPGYTFSKSRSLEQSLGSGHTRGRGLPASVPPEGAFPAAARILPCKVPPKLLRAVSAGTRENPGGDGWGWGWLPEGSALKRPLPTPTPASHRGGQQGARWGYLGKPALRPPPHGKAVFPSKAQESNSGRARCAVSSQGPSGQTWSLKHPAGWAWGARFSRAEGAEGRAWALGPVGVPVQWVTSGLVCKVLEQD